MLAPAFAVKVGGPFFAVITARPWRIRGWLSAVASAANAPTVVPSAESDAFSVQSMMPSVATHVPQPPATSTQRFPVGIGDDGGRGVEARLEERLPGVDPRAGLADGERRLGSGDVRAGVRVRQRSGGDVVLEEHLGAGDAVDDLRAVHAIVVDRADGGRRPRELRPSPSRRALATASSVGSVSPAVAGSALVRTAATL